MTDPRTAEEKQEDAEFDDVLKQLLEARELILEDAGEIGEGKGGKIPCPVEGCEGLLRYSIAGCNGHVHACCTTAGCLKWME